MEKVFLDLLTYLEMKNCRKLSWSFPVLFDKLSPKGLKKKMLWAMHGMVSQKPWNLFKPIITFILTLISFFETCIHLA